MQIQSLKTFCDLVETKSFTRTAELNEVTQSAVSQTIAAVEKRFNSLLVERSSKSFRLTPEGQVVYEYCKRIMQSYEAIHSKLQEIRYDISGVVRLATVYSIGLHKIPPYHKLFLKCYPTVKLQVEFRQPDRVYEEVLASVVDLGLVNFPVAASQLQVVHLPAEPLVLVCHPQHAFAKLKTIHLKALHGQKFISFQPEIPTRQALDRFLRQQGVTVEHVMEMDNIETLKQAVELGSGVAILPIGTVALEVHKETLATVPLAGKYTRKWGVIYKKGKVLSPAMKQLIALLQKPL